MATVGKATMTCPADGCDLRQAMVDFPGWSANLWECRDWRGEFVPGNEVRRLLLDKKGLTFGDPPAGRADATARSCPACRQAMPKRFASGVVVDACGQCGGLWLDRHEYEGLLSDGDQPSSLQLPRRSGETDARHRLGTRLKDEGTFRKGFVAGWLLRAFLGRLSGS